MSTPLLLTALVLLHVFALIVQVMVPGAALMPTVIGVDVSFALALLQQPRPPAPPSPAQ